MAIVIRDEHLEAWIDRHRAKRGDKTLAKTTSDLIREKLTEMELEERQDQAVVRPQALAT